MSLANIAPNHLATELWWRLEERRLQKEKDGDKSPYGPIGGYLISMVRLGVVERFPKLKASDDELCTEVYNRMREFKLEQLGQFSVCISQGEIYYPGIAARKWGADGHA